MIDISKIKDPSDRPLIDESIKLFENGFYRSSYIMAWLSGVESLRRRFEAGRNVSTSLETIYNEIRRMEGNKKSIDAYVIEKAKDSFMISDLEYQKLEYFYRMRCIFSHPYEQTPLANDCEHIINSIITIILSKDLLYGKDTIDNILNKIENEQSYIEDNEEKIVSFFKDILLKTDETIYNYTLTNLSSFYETYTPINPFTDIIKNRIKICIHVLINLKPIDFYFKDDTQKETFIYSNKKSAFLIFSRPDVLSNISEHVQDIIISELINAKQSEFIACIVNSSHTLSESINDKCEKYINSLSTASDLKYFNAPKIIERCIILLKSLDFNKQNVIPTLFRQPNFLKTLHACDKNYQILLGRNILQSGNGYLSSKICSNDCYYLIDNYTPSYNYPNNVLIGMALELLIKEDYTLRPKFELLPTINNLLIKLDPAKKNKILNAVENEVIKAKSVRNHTDWAPLATASEFTNLNTVVQSQLTTLGFIP